MKTRQAWNYANSQAAGHSPKNRNSMPTRRSPPLGNTKKKFSPPKVSKVPKVIKRWYNLQMTGDELQKSLLDEQPKFRKYAWNIYQLNKAAIRIQHWFFKKRKYEKKIKYVEFIRPKHVNENKNHAKEAKGAAAKVKPPLPLAPTTP